MMRHLPFLQQPWPQSDDLARDAVRVRDLLLLIIIVGALYAAFNFWNFSLRRVRR
jgi:hypothetical protein